MTQVWILTEFCQSTFDNTLDGIVEDVLNNGAVFSSAENAKDYVQKYIKNFFEYDHDIGWEERGENRFYANIIDMGAQFLLCLVDVDPEC